MSAAHIAAVVFAGSFVAAMVGMLLRKILPDNHLDSDAKDVMKLVMGLIGTMAALILGLLIASGNSSYNAQRSELQTLAANAVILDRLLQAYGPEAAGTRESFRQSLRYGLSRTCRASDETVPVAEGNCRVLRLFSPADEDFSVLVEVCHRNVPAWSLLGLVAMPLRHSACL